MIHTSVPEYLATPMDTQRCVLPMEAQELTASDSLMPYGYWNEFGEHVKFEYGYYDTDGNFSG